MPLSLVPDAPGWRPDWEGLLDAFPVLAPLALVPQTARFHGEGDVLTHTRMVVETLVASPRWRRLDRPARRIVFLAALLHDIGKAKTTTETPDGALTSRGHSARGVRMARRLLWELEVPFREREEIVNLIRYHQCPFWAFERDDRDRLIREISLNVPCDRLAILADADARGRICSDMESITTAIALFEELAESLDCWETPARFATDHARFLYFRDKWPTPEYAPHEDFNGHITILSGLPGAGKDHYIGKRHADRPVISLDRIREECGVHPGKRKQGPVVRISRDGAREHLRTGTPFVWNATNVSLGIRRQVVDLAWRYHAEIELVYIEPSMADLFAQNRNRNAAVPDKVIWDLMDHRLDVPDPWEAHQVTYVADRAPGSEK